MADNRSEFVEVEVALHDDVECIETREDLARFIEHLKRDYDDTPSAWENGDVPSYLEALAAWAQDMPGYFANRGEDLAAVPPWRLLGMMLLAARSYE